MVAKFFKTIFGIINLIFKLEFKEAYRKSRMDLDKFFYKLLKGKTAWVPYPPRFVTIMLSGYCSQECVFCCHHSQDAKNGKYKHLYKLDYNMPFKVFCEIVDKCYKARVPRIHICGNGEPTIHPDFLKCLDYVIEKYGHVSFQSNFDHRIYKQKKLVEEVAKREKYINYITMDLVGHNNETHNPLKKGSHFDSILELMSSINKKAPGIKFHAHWILTKHNYKGIDKLLFKLKQGGVNFKLDIVNLHAYEFNDFCSLEARYLLGDDHIRDELNRVKRIADDNKFDISIPLPSNQKTNKCEVFWSRLQIGFGSRNIPREKWHGNCLCGACNAVVKGNLFGLGDILESNSVRGVWNGSKIKDIRKGLLKGRYPDQKCQDCQNYIEEESRPWQSDLSNESLKMKMEKYINYKELKSKENLRILDFGCGNGRYSYFFKELFPQAEIYALDVDLEEKHHLKDEKIKFKEISSDYVDFDFEENYFDLIFSSNVIEHIPRDQYLVYLKRFKKSLKEDGRFVFGTPNYPHKRFYDILKALKNLKKFNFGLFKYYLFDDPTHINKLNYKKLEKDLEIFSNFYLYPTKIFFNKFIKNKKYSDKIMGVAKK